MLFLSSCEKDLYEDAFQNDNSKMIVKKMNEKDLEKFRILQQKLNHIRLFKNSVQNKIITDTVYNFTISTDEAIYIEKENTHSFTFPISRTGSSGKLENLLLSQNKEGGYNTFLVQYDFSAEKLKTITKEELQGYKTKYTFIDFDAENLLNSKIGAFSVFMCVETWTGVEHETYEGNYDGDAVDIEIIWTNTSSVCNWVNTTDGFFGSGGGSTTSTGNSTSGSGYTGSNSGNTNVDIVGTLHTSPTPCSKCPPLNLDYSNFLSHLDTIQNNYLEANPAVLAEIENYFNQSGVSSAFANEAMNNIINGGESDFINRVLIDPSFKNNFPCQANLVKKAYQSNGQLAKSFLTAFGNNNFQHVIFNAIDFNTAGYANQSANTVIFTSNGQIQYTATAVGNTFLTGQFFNINLNSNVINTSTDLATISVIYHEMFHALLLHFSQMGYFTVNTTQSNNPPTYYQLLEAYTQATNNTSVSQHDFMISYINLIKNAIKTWGQNNGYNQTDDFYLALAWGNLYQKSFNVENPVFSQLDTLTKNYIKNVYYTEINNIPTNGYSPTQNSNSCN